MININYTFILTIINFLILVYVLKKLLWAPLTKFLDDRARGIEESIRAAEVNQEEAQRLVEHQEETLREARMEAREIVDRGIAEASREARNVRHEGEKQATKIIEQGRADIALEVEQAKLELRNQAADLSVALAERILRRSLGEEDHRALIETSLREWTN
ncbi:MAG: F0F1 ATP synthase subunit B [Candidatus Latescibacteria bacterium]|nr:F0F1 ATP synthase subunit B [Candidatus Latescibacterota bacterium]MCK5526651.1 F0F1 ATP synthase subunit B [Candidatus Latescibacterota bacterium]MCK5734425.1 F0F1 ATP synthase subunit B [Candidatus Latescibacterota bacterium]